MVFGSFDSMDCGLIKLQSFLINDFTYNISQLKVLCLLAPKQDGLDLEIRRSILRPKLIETGP